MNDLAINGALRIAVSGLHAAEGRAVVAAGNLVNAHTTSAAPSQGAPYQGYVPQAADTVSQAGGGVNLVTRPVEPSHLLLPQADGTTQAMPNVEPVAEAVALNAAAQAYKANAAVIRTADDMERTLLDVLG